MKLLLKNANIDILIQNGIISAVGADARNTVLDESDKSIDCEGLTIIPGICDMHVHLRDPGQTHKEDLFTASEAAAAGGVTAVVCMPNTTPVIDTPELVRDIIQRSKSAKVKVYPCAAITKGLQGEELTDFAALKKAGAVAVSDDGMPVVSDELMEAAMVNASQAGLGIISHCEPENEMTLREVGLAGRLGVPVHVAHVSTKEALSCINENVTFEVAPHHFTLTQDDVKDSDYKMNPPLRTADDVAALIELLCNDNSVKGTCAIASDHAPHTPEEKSGDNPPNGVLGLETILAVTLTQLYHTNKLTLDRIVELLCTNPRRILKLPEVSLSVGSPADIAIVDLNEEWTVLPQRLHSKSKNTCFKGMTLKGKVKYTILNGKVVYDGI